MVQKILDYAEKQFTHFICGKKRFTQFFAAKTICAFHPESFCALNFAKFRLFGPLEDDDKDDDCVDCDDHISQEGINLVVSM